MDPSQMMFPMWAPPPAAVPPPSEDPSAPFLPPPNAQLAPNRGWKRKNPSSAAGYQPPALGDLQVQNRAKARRWFKNHNPSQNNPNHHHNNRKYFFPKNKAAAPRNTTSFIIRAKRAGGIASLVSPCPVTPAVLPTPRLSPSREGLADMAQAQWGVDGYGSMKGLIRLRSSPQPADPNSSDDDDEGNSSGSDVEEHVEVERRLDHDLSRFEMVYPARGEDPGGYVFEEDDEYDQDAHVARLEEENLTLKERLFLMEQEVGDMRRRLEALEARFSLNDGVGGGGGENAVEEAPPQNDANRENSSEDNAERVDVGSEKSGEKNADKGVVDLENIGENNADKGAVDSEKKHNAEKGAVGSEKSGEHNAGMVDSVSEKIIGEDDGEVMRLDASLQ
ncbi:uncharacterized protein LOC133920178 [Phragmites australis]|uniref:uncharacterized protein LOC133920178 n=1 Tax=Phragmites australis TaxID=29695 RepID=UPI002D782F68|nr:uncharacterized protein LOC133920178 [Phragmites australis]